MTHESPIAPEGVPFIISAVLITSVCVYFNWKWAAIVFGLTTLWVVWFFRNPRRVAPADPRLVISPADGRVIGIETVSHHDLLPGPLKKVSIFMNVFSVHVNRIPYSGVIADIRYYPGKFLSANLDKASADNERNALLIDVGGGEKMVVIQIAGLVARRIVCWVTKGMKVNKGERFGLIRFGSRLEVFMPPRVRLRVQVGEKVRAGETPIGELP
ncbi:MAG TPA: phosphatidylserine decarboxylase family protein [Syntrophales bacterium]|jgi:phosphatidylserine decarboxylase|nr:phosphatidylserine decarboxylase family protein [Syntrophales bacterium]HON22612.1 phosphatidylserine decarboxylase family protein [Syntrophales bacterium]HOU77106.1 phosphatidylserine decarboxylase family protein [Syntrophales bacterium]HPC32786.1 phosphatidylserine decarboxylase family protein [Syntrophales bacterium]HQG33634.1 phosphatidylserine decarboxylase family protein [Syntrophales bacterium]